MTDHCYVYILLFPCFFLAHRQDLPLLSFTCGKLFAANLLRSCSLLYLVTYVTYMPMCYLCSSSQQQTTSSFLDPSGVHKVNFLWSFNLYNVLVTAAQLPWSLTTNMFLKFLTYNVQGLNSLFKHSIFWRDALKSHADVICIQETHLLATDTHRLKHRKFPYIFHSTADSKWAGVTIIVRDSIAFQLSSWS